jgi:ribonuclease J
MMHGGYAGVALAMDEMGELLADPRVVFQGLPDNPMSGELGEASIAAVRKALKALSNGKARDDDAVKEAARVALRRTCRSMCGKRPVVDVQILRLPSR